MVLLTSCDLAGTIGERRVILPPVLFFTLARLDCSASKTAGRPFCGPAVMPSRSYSTYQASEFCHRRTVIELALAYAPASSLSWLICYPQAGEHLRVHGGRYRRGVAGDNFRRPGLPRISFHFRSIIVTTCARRCALLVSLIVATSPAIQICASLPKMVALSTDLNRTPFIS